MPCSDCVGIPNLGGKDLLAAAQCHKLYNGVEIPLMGLGTWRLRGSKLISAVCGALQEGYGLIDSAAVYENEEEIRDILHKMGNPRVFLTSKLQPKDAQSKESVLCAFDMTLKRLGVEKLDLYLIHWPGSGGLETNDPENRRRRIENWRALETLYEQKKVRAIGVSNFLPKHIEDLMKDGAKIVPMVNQLEWHPFLWFPEMITLAKKHNIILQAYASLGSGDQRLLYSPVVNKIAEEVKASPSAVLLRWPIQQGLLVIPCSTSREHLRENARALTIKLTENHMQQINALKDSDQCRFCWDPRNVA